MVQAAEGPALKQGLGQFVKFCIVGFTSTVIDFAVLNALTLKFHMPWYFAKVISFLFSVTNGFIWNSIWTFRGMGSGRRHEQYIKFTVVNLVGLVLSMCIIKIIVVALGGDPVHQQVHLNIANAISVVVVSTWNFLANRKWTFA